jgi:hypothetical protein
MKKKWMFLIAEMAAMIILSLINKWQSRDRQLPRGSKVGRIKGLPVVNFGWFKRNSVPLPPATQVVGATSTEGAGAEPDPIQDYVWTPPVDPKKSA